MGLKAQRLGLKGSKIWAQRLMLKGSFLKSLAQRLGFKGSGLRLDLKGSGLNINTSQILLSLSLRTRTVAKKAQNTNSN